MTLWVIWKKAIKLLVDLDPEDAKNASDIYYEKIEMPFNSVMMEFLMPVTPMI